MQPTLWKAKAQRHPIATALLVIFFLALGWAALAPIKAVSRDATFEIPRGTYARHMAGQHADVFPQTIRLTLGLKDVLVLRNKDDVPHIFGPALIMPGQSFTLPFVSASTYSFQCTAHPNGGLTVIVDPAPAPGLNRLRWRWRKLAETV